MKNRTRTLFRVGAWSWVITGVGHSALEAVRLISPVPEANAALTAAMRAHTVDIGGVSRSMHDLLTGFSLAMGFVIAFVGVLLLLVARTAPQLIEDGVGLTWLALAGSLTLLTLAVLFMPSPPILLFTVAGVSYGLSLLVRRRREAAVPATS